MGEGPMSSDMPRYEPPEPGLEDVTVESRPAVPAPDGADAATQSGIVEHSGARITGLWASGDPDSTWIAIEGIGWRQLSSHTASGMETLTMLAGDVLRAGSTATIVVDGGRVTGIYVW